MADGQFDLVLFDTQAPIENSANLKLCWVCSQTKPVDAFGKDASRGDGLNPRCKACCAAIYQKRAESDRRTEKKCSFCEIVKPLSEYDEGTGAKRSLLRKRCRDCIRQYGTGTPAHLRKPFARSPNANQNNKAYKKRLSERQRITPPNEQVCTSCDILKPSSDFSLCRTEKAGIKRACKACCENARVASLARPRVPAKALRTCSRCAASLPQNRFSKKSDSPDGYAPKCKDCERLGNIKWYASPENRTRAIAKAKLWVENNPDLARANSKVTKQRRRTRESKSNGSFTQKEWIEVLHYYGNSCAYCLSHASSVGDMTVDHLRPLSKGGSNYIGNIVPACFRCNQSKGNSTILELLHRGWTPPGVRI